MKDLHLLKAREIAKLVNEKQIKAVDIARYFLDRAYQLNPTLNALNSITEELAIKQAADVDARIANGETMALAGVPIAIKDNINVIGTETTCSSKLLKGYQSTFESHVTTQLWTAGAICIGKANLDEFAMGSSTENSAFGASKNPYDTGRVPGGSSGGSAVAVASRMVPVSLGSDTGGSIRQPASLCGIVGLKPTYGYVSRYGLVAFASSLDQIGPFATDVEDAHLIMSVISGYDNHDSTSMKDISYNSDIQPKDINGLRVGLVKEILNSDQISAEVKASYQSLIDSMKAKGAIMTEISMPVSTDYALDCYYIIAPAEASSNLSRYDGVRYGQRAEAEHLTDLYVNSRSEGFGDEVKRRIIIGTYVLSAGYYDAYYKKAQKVRRLITEEYQKAFENVDILLMPTSPITAFPFGSKTEDPLSMYLCDILTIPVNLAGVPAISINAGYDADGLPIGMQIVAGIGKDHDMMNISKSIEGLITESVSEQLPVHI